VHALCSYSAFQQTNIVIHIITQYKFAKKCQNFQSPDTYPCQHPSWAAVVQWQLMKLGYCQMVTDWRTFHHRLFQSNKTKTGKFNLSSCLQKLDISYNNFKCQLKTHLLFSLQRVHWSSLPI